MQATLPGCASKPAFKKEQIALDSGYKEAHYYVERYIVQ